MVGLVGTAAQMITRTFYTCDGNWASCDALVGRRLSFALGFGAFGLIVSLVAYVMYRYLSNQAEHLSVEMHAAGLELINRLSVTGSRFSCDNGSEGRIG